MIGLALLVHPHELWVSVSGVYRDLSPEHFELTADHRKQKIRSIEKIDPSKWSSDLGWKEGWDLWRIRFSAPRVDSYKACLRISLVWNGHSISQKTAVPFRTLLIDLYDPEANPLPAWEACFPHCTEEESCFALWAPFAKKVSLLFFDHPERLKPSWLLSMRQETEDGKGFWRLRVPGNLHGTIYKYVIEARETVLEILDPFSISVTANSRHSVLLDRRYLNPPGWEADKRLLLRQYNDAILYESHVRDFTVDPRNNSDAKGSYLAWTFPGVKTAEGLPAGLDHLEELGITHVHLLPVQDFGSVDDTHKADYNWGYDPLCYTVPEGSYSLDPQDPAKRVLEMKQLVQSLHNRGIGVILDVVYNHVWNPNAFSLAAVFSEPLFRLNVDGSYSNGSGCGNEFDTKHPAFQHYFLETLRYWIQTFHVDGFRFDLMGLIDRRTMESTARALHKEFPGILLYGEPWTGGDTPLPPKERSAGGFPKDAPIAIFDDRFRNAVKGFPDDQTTGFVTGHFGRTQEVLERMASIDNFNERTYRNPCEFVIYDSCHDNLTLFDKLRKSRPDLSIPEVAALVKCCHFLVSLSQGIPFFHSGEEFCRTKYGQSNSYQSGDLYNAIDWGRKDTFAEVFRYLRGLLAIRKTYSLLRPKDGETLARQVYFLEKWDEGFAYALKGKGKENSILIGIHLGASERTIAIPPGDWEIYANPLTAGEDLLGIAKDHLYFPPRSWYFAVKKKASE